jgi:hypothetical protein
MFALLQAFLQIALRRLGPEDLPDSRFLMGVALVGYVLAQVPIAVLLHGWEFSAARAIAADALLLAGFFWVMLWASGRLSRYRRTLSALLGAGALLTVMQWPLVWWWKMGAAEGEGPIGATVGLLAMMVWSILIQAHIAARALSSPFGAGMLVAVAYFLLNYEITAQLAPPVP